MYIPKRTLTNADLGKMVDTSDEWIVERTGIRERHIISEGESNAFMTAEAARQAMQEANVAPEELDMIIVGTNSPDTLFPGVGPVVQGLLGAPHAGGMDVQAGCPGGLFATVAAAGGIASGIWNHVVAAGSDAFSPLVDYTNRNTCVIFGDGAGAFLLSPWREGMMRVTHADLKADGEKSDYITLPAGGAAEPASEETVRERKHFVQMQGRNVFKYVTRMLPDYLENFCDSCGLTTKDIDWWIFHQANIRIIEALMRRMEIPNEKTVINLDKYGNIPAATIMTALHEAHADGRIQPGQKILVSSFGAGMTYGAVLIES